MLVIQFVHFVIVYALVWLNTVLQNLILQILFYKYYFTILLVDFDAPKIFIIYFSLCFLSLFFDLFSSSFLPFFPFPILLLFHFSHSFPSFTPFPFSLLFLSIPSFPLSLFPFFSFLSLLFLFSSFPFFLFSFFPFFLLPLFFPAIFSYMDVSEFCTNWM